MRNATPNEKNHKILILLCGVLAGMIMLVSYVAALGKFNPPDIDPVSSDVISEEVIESSVEESVTVSEEEEYEYYSKINFERRPYANSLVANGPLAVINETSKTFPIVNEADIVNVGSVKTANVYGFSNMSLVMYEEAIVNIDKFIVSFYEQVPSNGLIINKAYTASSALVPDEKTIDLCTGYSTQFSIYNSSYKFSDSEFAYLREQAYRFGVIQRYPNGKENYTGFTNDNTIYRYVGLSHSMYMNHYMLSLEEYIDRVRTYKVIEFESELESDTVYVTYYVPLSTDSDTTYIDVPSGDEYEYTVSGDGDKGFVVTVKIQL